MTDSKQHLEPKLLDMVRYRLDLRLEKPNGKAWYGAYQHDVRGLLEQLQTAQEENTKLTVQLGTFLANGADIVEERESLREQLQSALETAYRWQEEAIATGNQLNSTNEQLETVRQQLRDEHNDHLQEQLAYSALRVAAEEAWALMPSEHVAAEVLADALHASNPASKRHEYGEDLPNEGWAALRDEPDPASVPENEA